MLRCAILGRTVLACVLACASAPALAQWEIRVWHAMKGAQGADFERLAERFNAAQQDYRVVLSHVGDYDQTLAAALATRARGSKTPPPHVVHVHDTGTAEMLKRRGLVMPLWQVLEDAGERLDGYLPAVEAPFADGDGRLLALPFNAATPVLYYNRDALRAAKIEPPKTWYEMPEVLAALQKAGYGCAYTTAYPSWVLLENMSAWHDQSFATQRNGMGGADARLSFNSRLMVRWISMLSTWRQSGYFMYWGRSDEAEARFAADHCALLTSSSASYAALRKRAAFDLGVAQLPYYDDFDEAPQNTLAATAGLWVLAGKPPVEYYGVARFFAFLAQPGVQAEWHQKSGELPLTYAAYELTRKQGFYAANPGQEIAVQQVLAKLPTWDSRGIRLGGFPKIRGIINEELELVWGGNKSALDALNAAVARGNALLDELEKADSGR
ncbi:MAG TPA: sn-glycerol-3-phosphate ABC transporter substrate-binding protein UgpB [Burkholderiales bacterium]